MQSSIKKKLSDFKDFNSFETFLGAEYNPDEKLLLYSVKRYDANEQRLKTRVYLRDQLTGYELEITAGGEGESSASFSPDYETILFVSSVPDKGRQVYLYNRLDASVTKLTNMRQGILDPRFSPDGTKILFASSSDVNRDAAFDANRDLKMSDHQVSADDLADDAVIIEDFGYKFDGAGFIKPEHLHLWVLNLETQEVSRITDGPFDYLHHTWSPDSRHVLCTSSRFRPKKDAIASDLIIIDSQGQEDMVQLTHDNWTVSYPNPVRPIYTPDHKYVVMGFLDERTKDPRREKEGYPPSFLHLVSVDGKVDKKLMDESESCYDGVAFAYNAHCGAGLDKMKISSDGQYAYFLSGHKGAEKLFKVALYSEESDVQVVIDEKVAINGLGEPINGKMLFSMSTPTRPEGYYLLDETRGTYECLLQSNEAYLKEKAIQKTEDFFFETLDGESRVHTFVLPPQNAKPGEKYPCILYVHGGPHPFYTYGFTLEFQCFAGHGIGVIFCNPRGSSGYGTTHRNLERATDGSAYMDCLQCVQEAARRYDWIDQERLGVTGGSYGGYMTNYIATHSPKFKAYVSQRSVVNDLISYASSDMQGDSSAYPHFEEFMIKKLEESTVSYVERIHAPFLILHGMDDYRTPVEGAHQLFVGIKDLHPDLPVKMVLYPETGHSQPRDPQNLQHYYHEMISWFKKYL